MTVIYARTNLPRKCRGCSKYFKNIIRVTNKYINCGPWSGVVRFKNKAIIPQSIIEPPELKISTNHMKFIARGETKPLDIETNRSWIII